MKRLVKVLLLTVAFLGLTHQNALSFEKMDLDTNSLVIKKLEKALPLSSDKTVKYKILLLRLGDAYSERARLRYIEETKRNSKRHSKSKKDRRTAISYYQKSLSHLNSRGEKISVYYQIAHLSHLNGDFRTAERNYKTLTSMSQIGRLPALSFIALGEISYMRRNHKAALNYFNSALKTKNPPREGYLIHRKAWAHYALGQTKSAKRLTKLILQSPKLLSGSNGRIDTIFHTEVAHDFAIFAAKLIVSNQLVEEIKNLTPQKDLKSVLFALSNETERLGKHKSTLIVLNSIRKNIDLIKVEEAQLAVRYSLLAFNLDDRKKALAEYEKAVKLWDESSCDESKCGTLKTEIRNLLVHWQKRDKTNPNRKLLGIYKTYLETFTRDSELYIHAGLLANELKLYRDSINFHKKGFEISSKKKQKESHLLGLLESAEETKNHSLKISTFDYYLENSQNSKDRSNVLYLKAKSFFDNKKYDKSGEIFKSLAFSKGLSTPLRIESGNYFLKGLTLTNKHEAIYNETKALNKIFPGLKKSYASANRIAALKIAKIETAKKKNSDKNLEQSQNRLESAMLQGASQAEKTKIDLAALLISIQRKDLKGTVRLSNRVLKNKKLTRSQRDQILLDLAWAHELLVNFAAAYNASIRVSNPRVPKAKWSLKLALLAELAGKPHKDHYKNFIKHSRSRRESNLIRAKLIREGGVNWSEIKEERSALLYSPDILSELILEAYAKRTHRNQVEPYLEYRRVRRTLQGSAVDRHLVSLELRRSINRIKSHKLRTNSQYLLNKTMAGRIKKLSQLEELANKAVGKADWVLMSISFETLSKEYERFIDDVKDAPIPKSIKGNERTRYKTELESGLKPFQQKRSLYTRKSDEFWSDQKSIDQYVSLLENANKRTKSLLKREALTLADASPSGSNSRKIRNALNSSNKSKISISSISEAWKEVKKNPFDLDALEDLKDLETKRGSETVLSYIDLRMKTIKGGS